MLKAYKKTACFVAMLFLITSCGGGGNPSTPTNNETDDATFGEFVSDLANTDDDLDNQDEPAINENPLNLNDLLYGFVIGVDLDLSSSTTSDWYCNHQPFVDADANSGYIGYSGPTNDGVLSLKFPEEAIGIFASNPTLVISADSYLSAPFNLGSGNKDENYVEVNFPDIGAQDVWRNMEFTYGDGITAFFDFTSDVFGPFYCVGIKEQI